MPVSIFAKTMLIGRYKHLTLSSQEHRKQILLVNFSSNAQIKSDFIFRNVFPRSLDAPSTSTTHVKFFINPPARNERRKKLFNNSDVEDLDQSVFSQSRE